METLESVFTALPNGCSLKNPNSYNSRYQCVYKDHSKNAVHAYGDTPKEAVIRLVELLTPTKEER